MKKENRSLNDEIFECNVSLRFDDDIQSVILTKDVKKAVKNILEKIRMLPNRDDKIMSNIKTLDGGGVGRFEVMKIIEDEMGEGLNRI